MTITLAVTAKWSTYPQRLDWIQENGFALEYAPNPEILKDLPKRISPYMKKGLAIRYHAFLPGYEIGHADFDRAEEGLRMHKNLLTAIRNWGEPVLTIHIGLNPEDQIDQDRAVDNLTTLVNHGKSLGLIVCLENLRRGLTSDPAIVLDWAERSGSMITLDIGHAVSSNLVVEGHLSPLDYINVFSDKLYEIHLYGFESDRHYPPKRLEDVKPMLDLSLKTNCKWWTIELDDYEEILFTKGLISGYLEEGTV